MTPREYWEISAIAAAEWNVFNSMRRRSYTGRYWKVCLRLWEASLDREGVRG